ncbi:hypothetical protein [Polycladidibacter hongkongensis]|uniref:hypothetical protein n=1 Tax=Polycladidibacter hongkongensis TaxID=1647556 RepID=UPI0012E33B86|nr:hypothetical protein [Pseudovibrio hongkongensis]
MAIAATSFVLFALSVFSSFEHSDGSQVFPDDIDTSASPSGVVALPEQVPPAYRGAFVNYTKVIAPNGKPIHILAQKNWTEAQIVKGRSVLEHILRDAPNSRFGKDKTNVANTIANTKGAMVFLNTEASFNTPEFEEFMRRNDFGGIQDLRANETPVEGTVDYLEHRTRDASFEEILHFVHDYGIKPALPDFQKQIEAASDAATARGFQGWPEDEPENHNNEYFAAVYDVYLDLWKRNPTLYEGQDMRGEVPAGTTHFGAYPLATNREELAANDPKGLAIINGFFQPFLTYIAELPESFSGTFSLREDGGFPYSYKASRLAYVRLHGDNPAKIIGNAYDNRFWGNAGDNEFDGGAGHDTTYFSGNFAEYSLTAAGERLTVRDNKLGRDGTDTLKNIEALQFADRTVPVPAD